jgi:hypothetical protein
MNIDLSAYSTEQLQEAEKRLARAVNIISLANMADLRVAMYEPPSDDADLSLNRNDRQLWNVQHKLQIVRDELKARRAAA